MTFDFDEINMILSAMHDEGMVEPIDDPNVTILLMKKILTTNGMMILMIAWMVTMIVL